eukprot:COSAG02_NODE_8475_length_2558_cov_541.326556_2_plen_66_part_00
MIKGSENKDAISRNTEIWLGISNTRWMLAKSVACLPSQTNVVAQYGVCLRLVRELQRCERAEQRQ